MISRHWVVVLTFALTWGSYPDAHAEAGSNATDARNDKAAFAEAVRLYKSDDFAGALPRFLDVAHSTNSPNAHLYVGYCLDKLGRPGEAYAAFEQAVRASGTEKRYEKTREVAESELAELSQHVARLVVSPAELPEGLVVKVDGHPVEASAFGAQQVVSVGDHRVEATAPGKVAVVRNVHLDAGENKTIALAFERPTSTVASAPTRDRSTHGGDRSAFRVAGFAAAGVGVVGFATFAVAGLRARAIYGDLESECANAACNDSGHVDDIRSGKRWQTIANVGLIVGSIGVASGAALLYFGFSESRSDGVAVSSTRGGGLLSYRSEF